MIIMRSKEEYFSPPNIRSATTLYLSQSFAQNTQATATGKKYLFTSPELSNSHQRSKNKAFVDVFCKVEMTRCKEQLLFPKKETRHT